MTDDGTWRCAACQESKATQCCFCETKSTQLFRRPTYPNCFSWVHTACLHADCGKDDTNSGVSKKEKQDKKSKKRKHDDSDDSDDEDDADQCAVCADDDKRVDLQRVNTWENNTVYAVSFSLMSKNIIFVSYHRHNFIHNLIHNFIHKFITQLSKYDIAVFCL